MKRETFAELETLETITLEREASAFRIEGDDAFGGAFFAEWTPQFWRP